MGLGYSKTAQKRQEDLHEQKMHPVRPVKKAYTYPGPKDTETTAPIFLKPGSVQPNTSNGDVKMPETKDDDSDEDRDFITKSLPAIREEAKLVLEKFLKRSLSQNDASPMRQVLHEPQLEVITEDKTVVSENGTHHSTSLGAKPKKKTVQSKNGALKVRPSFDRSDSYMAAAKRSVIDSIQKHGQRGADQEWKPQARNKANTVSSADYKDNTKRSSGMKYPRRASSNKAEGETPTPPTIAMMSTISTTTVDRKDSWSSRHDSSSDDDEDSFKKRKKKNVFTRAKERLRMSFRKRELNAREKFLRKESKRASPKHQPAPQGGAAPVINIHKATPSPDKSSSSSLPNSSPSTGDILDSITHPTPSSRGSYDKTSSNGFEFKQSGSRDCSEGRHTPTTPSPSGSKKFKVKTGSQTPTTPSPSSSKKFRVKTGSDSSRHSTRGVESEESKNSLWQWLRNSKLGVKRRSSKEKGSRTPTKNVEITSTLTVSDTRINQVNQVKGSTDIVRTSSLGRYEGMRIQQGLSLESRTNSAGAHDSHRFKRPGDIIVAHGPSGKNLDSGRDAPKRKESFREELKRTFSINKGDNIGIQKKHSFKGRCLYADRENLKLDLVPCRPRPSGGEGLSSVVVPDCLPGTPDENKVLTTSLKFHSDRSETEKGEIYDRIAERLDNIAEDYPSTPLRSNVATPPQQRATVVVAHSPTPPGAAGGYDGPALEKEIAKYLRNKGDNMDLVDGTAIPQEALAEIVRTMSYKKFKKVMRQYTQNSEPDFHQMAQLFHLARGAVQLVGVGGNAVTTIKDYTLNYFVDYFAGWIIGKGGWDSVIEDSDEDEGGTQV
ncbi:uncharacterized protein LOC135488331 isoform X2 [Lineus longissimus]|uniref:uncharacterized protein LOC135488331 isoform X2 n=1 Tax=Lineus longissimus TaxID=88925 RepID=UPI00315DABDC